MTDDRPPRCRPLPPHAVDAVSARGQRQADRDGEVEGDLQSRLGEALARLPEAERRAVVAAVGYGEGAVGAAMEAEVDVAEGDALTRRGIELLRTALEPRPDPA